MVSGSGSGSGGAGAIPDERGSGEGVGDRRGLLVFGGGKNSVVKQLSFSPLPQGSGAGKRERDTFSFNCEEGVRERRGVNLLAEIEHGFRDAQKRRTAGEAKEERKIEEAEGDFWKRRTTKYDGRIDESFSQMNRIPGDEDERPSTPN